MNARERLREAKRIVVKVGTSTLVRTSGKPDFRRMDRLVREIADLKNAGREMVLVSSGAIAIGMDSIGLREKPAEIPARQALAAIGQSSLMTLYKKFFADYGQTAAQVLLTKENAARHHQYANSRNALLELLAMGAVPVINENDVVAVDEIKIGDNDTLSATVATLIDADALLILSDIDGLYTANPQEDKTARLIPEVAEITPEIERMAGGAGSSFGTGGMATKIEAAKIAVNAGATFVIAPSAKDDVISAVLAGETVGTVFPAKETSSSTRAARRRCARMAQAFWQRASAPSRAASRRVRRCACCRRVSRRLRAASSITVRSRSRRLQGARAVILQDSSRARSTRRSSTATIWF